MLYLSALEMLHVQVLCKLTLSLPYLYLQKDHSAVTTVPQALALTRQTALQRLYWKTRRKGEFLGFLRASTLDK